MLYTILFSMLALANAAALPEAKGAALIEPAAKAAPKDATPAKDSKHANLWGTYSWGAPTSAPAAGAPTAAPTPYAFPPFPPGHPMPTAFSPFPPVPALPSAKAPVAMDTTERI